MSYTTPMLKALNMTVANSCCQNPDCQASDPCTYASIGIWGRTVCVGENVSLS